jgi:urease accessory protein
VHHASQFSVVTSDARPKAGSGCLEFANVRGRTVLRRAFAASPLRLLTPRNAGDAAWTYLATYGGGLVGGDSLNVRIDVGRSASALVTTQASTKVYRTLTPGPGASQRLHARAGHDSLLVLLPDPVTGFAGSRYIQEQSFDLDDTASLVLVDWLTAGRVGSGERWQFDGYVSRTFVRRAGRLLLHDALSLGPEDGNVAGRLNRFNCLALVVLTGPRVEAAATRLAGAIGAAPLARHADLLLSAATLGEDDGVLLRIAGTSAQQVGAALKQHLSFVPSLLGDDPWSCRW